MNETRRREGILDAERTAAKGEGMGDAPEQTEVAPRDRRVLVTPSPTASAQPAATTEEIRFGRETMVSGPGVAAAKAPEDQREPLFAPNEANNLRGRWDSVQVGFVDQPRKAVEEADQLVSVTMKRLQEIFAEERQKMEHQWSQGTDASTEDYRVALRRYRSFFTRLLSI